MLPNAAGEVVVQVYSYTAEHTIIISLLKKPQVISIVYMGGSGDTVHQVSLACFIKYY